MPGKVVRVTCMMMSPLVKLLSTFPSTVVGKARYPDMPTIRYPIMITMIADTITPSIPICNAQTAMVRDGRASRVSQIVGSQIAVQREAKT